MHQQIPPKVEDAELSASAGVAGSEVHTGPQRVQFTWDGSCTL